MKIHEYQGKDLLKASGVAVPRGIVAHTAEEAAAAFEELGGQLAVVKSQIHAGGRGKGRFAEEPEQPGVVLVRSADEAREHASRMIGNTLVTIQTGEEGKTVKTLFVEEGLDIARELYLGIVIDRETSSPVLITSTEGGMAIEEVAAETPEKIHNEPFDVVDGLTADQARTVGESLGLDGEAMENAIELFPALCRFFVDNDCSLTEINPLVVTGAGQLLCLDAKVSFDDNAMFRHESFDGLRDLDEEDPAEVRAGEAGLSYVNLDGDIGCLVNGAGLAMATMDVIKMYGGEPANFLDIGGGADSESITAAFGIILEDPSIEGILVNIFGGIIRCDMVARSIIEASKETGLEVPLVVRFSGTNHEEGRIVLDESDLDVVTVSTLGAAGEAIVGAIGGLLE